ncbi:MAG: hypothetical protein ACK401_08295 [Archaeoglobaceae archaeon]
MEFYATLPPGLEDIAVEELKIFGLKYRRLKKEKAECFSLETLS